MRIVADDVSPESVSSSELGGKGQGLVLLRALGLPVPRFVVVTSQVFDDAGDRPRWLEPLLAGLEEAEWDTLVEASDRIADRIRATGCPAELREELQATLKKRGLAEARLAVRSSAVGEDSARHSFAGVMESRLNVPARDVPDALVDVWISAVSARALAYRQRKGLTLRHVRTAVVVQEMVPAVSAGVLFTLDPGRRDALGTQRTVSRARSVIVAGWGLGEGVVQDSVGTDTYRFDEDGAVVRRQVGSKTSRIVPSEAGGTHGEDVPECLRRRSVLADDQVRRLADVGVAIERTLGAPQDVEWAFDAAGRLLLLQSRPIVLPEPSPRRSAEAADDRRVWDNSNIVESYPGITLPLTFSFVRNAYAQAFRRACAAFFPLANPLEARPHLFVNLLGLLDGRVYYNLLNWYEMFSYLARPDRHRKTWDRMVGVRARASAAAPESVRPLRVRVMAALGALRVLLGVRRIARRFARLFEEFYRRRRGISEPTSPMALAIRFRVIEQEAARFWHLTLFIDLCAMRYHEWLAALVARWLPGHDDLADRLLAGEKGVESVAPARSLDALVKRVRAEPRWRERFAENDDAELWRALHHEASLAPLHEAIEEHVDRFGDRGIEELKLETTTFRVEPRRLLGVIRRALDSDSGVGSSVEIRRERQRERRRQAEAVVARRLGGLRRVVFRIVLGRAREAIRSRENMRFARSRLFGLVRGVFRRLAETLVEAGVLAEASDVFYLTTDEVLGHAEGTALTRDLQALVALRRGEYAEYAHRSPANRLETTGFPCLSPLPQVESEPAGGRRLEGTGCSAGAVTGPAHVVHDPGGASVRHDQVLVARSTDPGWVFLMMSSAGLVAERGSPLSHTAIIGRELGIPTVVGALGATARIPEGATLTIDGSTGEVQWV